jgi:ribonucleoside-diphosphate reductase beta chain
MAILLYKKYIQSKLSDETIHAIVREALKIEKEFILDSIPCKIIGMNAKLMSQYIDFVANRLVLQLGHSPLFSNVQNPFGFMDRINFDSKDNFFDGRVTSYQMSVERTVGDDVDELDFGARF